MFDDPKYWSYTDIEGRRYTPKNYPQRQLDILTEGKPYTPIISDIGKYFDELAYRAKEDPSSILLQGKYTMPLILSPLLAKGAATTLTNPYGDALLTSAFGAHGLQNITNGTANWETALEITPLGRVFKPIYNTTINLSKPIINKSKWLYNKGNIFNTSMKYNPNNFYREVSKEAIDDAVKSGVVRTGNSDKYIGPFFAKGSTPWRREKYIIEGYPEKNNWIYANPYENAFWVGKEDPLVGKTLMQQALNKKVSNNTIVGAEVFPYTNGSINATPTSNFSYWKKYPIIGWRKKSFKSIDTTPQITAENAASITSDTMTDVGDFSYKGLTSDTHDLFERMVYNDKIHGKPTYLFEQSVQTGIPETEYNELLHDVVGRNVREFKQAGLDDAQINAYISNAKNAMDNVRIGMYSDLDYKKAGMERFGGFYDNKGNFISINTGSTYTKPKIVKHEGRHLLDHKVDDELLMPTSNNFGNDFDSDIALSTMQKVKQNQNMILYDAYDNDFVTLPSKKGFNEGLEEYLYMDREAITTNLDARNELLGRKASWDINITDKIIDRVSDSAIFEAVEKANGYGRRYIRFLRENNKLTPKKAKQFREAMKHVGAIAAPMGVVGLGARIALDQKNTYNRGKDKGIHINPKNRGKFNALKKRTGKTTEQLTHSKNPLTRKRAIFAQNAKKWKKK